MWQEIWGTVAAIVTTVMAQSALNPASPVYMVVSPAKLRPNIKYHVSASVFNIEKPLELNVGIEGPSDSNHYNIISKDVTLKSGETQILSFEIGEWNSGNYSLVVSGEGGMKFHNQTVLTYEQKSYSVFIQTDKAIYKPQQLVQFRVLVVTPNLLPTVTGAINMYITDASNNRIKQWNRLFTTKGVVSGELMLSDQPVLGDWTINIDILGQIFKKTFTVAEYVLPSFSVDIDLPPFATYLKPDIVVTVNAKYTYGKPVKGHAKVTVKPSVRYGYLGNDEKPVVIEKEIDGSTDIPLNLVKDLGLDKETSSLEIDIIAEVEEQLTRRKYNTTSTINLYEREIKLELIKSTESFKPGLKYTAHLKVSYQDNTPAVITNGDQVILKYGYSYEENDYKSIGLSVPSNGFLSIDFYPPHKNVTFMNMNAEFRGITYHLDNIDAAMSPSNNFIQVLLLTESPTVDKQIELEINATEVLTYVICEVLGRGDIIIAQRINIPNTKTYRFALPVTNKMAPKARVIVYYVRERENEVVADAVNFDVSGLFRTPVTISTDVQTTKPGGHVNINVDTKPNALVGVLGIDQSVLLLKSGNDITQNDVIAELETYDGGKKKRFGRSYRKKRSLWWQSGSSTASEVFDDSGVIVLSNGWLYEYSQLIMYRSFNLEDTDDELNAVDTMMHGNGNGKGSAPRVRKHFPETWLWNLNPARNDGKMVISSKAPDTITSWIISAFAMDSVTGLGISPSTSKVTVYRPFFIKLNLPYSVIRSESVYVEAIIFNYNKKPMKANVMLENLKGEFEFTNVGNEIITDDKQRTKTVEVPAEDGISVPFLITPTKLGYIDLKVTATTTNAGDAVVRKLLVKPGGIQHFHNKAVLIALRDANAAPVLETVDIIMPTDIIEGSESVTISAIGDPLGPSVNNLDKLLRMPYGCGEQNMLNFVPNIVITKYLKKANLLTDSIKKKALQFMESGYQRELTYKRNDGSFSAFGNNDKNGSTWLTAFVARSFHQAKDQIDIDERVLDTALEWLSKRHKNDGSFMEIGEVHHKAMQGGSGSGPALTAYVLISFLENQVQKKYSREMDQATQYLLKELNKSDDPYVISLITYALHLAEHPEKDNALQKLLSMATRGVDSIHWARKGSSRTRTFQSQDVEMTAYALLTYSLRADIAGALPILKWMISQQNENGGYSSTQDTVVGIQALAEIASVLVSPTIAIDITYSYNDGKFKTLNITHENAMVLQKVMLPTDTRIVSLEAKGFGVGIVQVSWSYNVKSESKTPAFTLSSRMSRESTDDYMELNVCTKYNDVGASNMAVMEVSLPSGYQADAETFPSIKKLRTIKRVETSDGDTNVIIYFDRIGHDDVCVDVPAHRNHKVANQKPVPVKVYDYYDLAKTSEILYEPRSTTIRNICQGSDCVDGPNGSSTVTQCMYLLLFAALIAVLQ